MCSYVCAGAWVELENIWLEMSADRCALRKSGCACTSTSATAFSCTSTPPIGSYAGYHPRQLYAVHVDRPWPRGDTREELCAIKDEPCAGRPPKWKVYVDMFLNLPYPRWYREYAALNAPEEVAKYDDLIEDIHAVIGASPTFALVPLHVACPYELRPLFKEIFSVDSASSAFCGRIGKYRSVLNMLTHISPWQRCHCRRGPRSGRGGGGGGRPGGARHAQRLWRPDLRRHRRAPQRRCSQWRRCDD